MAPAVPPELQHAFDRERARAAADASPDAVDARAVTVRMYGRLADLQRDVIAERSVDVACKRGCSYCCHLRVEVRPHEAFVLAEHIARRFAPAQRTAILARIDNNLQRIAPLSAAAHVRAGIACALLDDDGACAAYDARPAACRKYHSVSVATCRNAFLDTSAPLTGDIEDETVRLAGNAVTLGHAQGLRDAGYDAELYELHFALWKALSEPKAAKRYRQRKKAFVDPK